MFLGGLRYLFAGELCYLKRLLEPCFAFSLTSRKEAEACPNAFHSFDEYIQMAMKLKRLTYRVILNNQVDTEKPYEGLQEARQSLTMKCIF